MRESCRSIEKVCTCPSRKLASGVPVPVDAGLVAAERVEAERAGRRWRLEDVEPLPAPVEARLDACGVPSPT